MEDFSILEFSRWLDVSAWAVGCIAALVLLYARITNRQAQLEGRMSYMEKDLDRHKSGDIQALERIEAQLNKLDAKVDDLSALVLRLDGERLAR